MNRRAQRTVMSLAALGGVFCLIGCHGPAAANGPTFITDPTPHVSWLQVDRFSREAELISRGSRSRAGDFTLDEDILSSGLGLSAAGSLYHPSLFTFSMALALKYQNRRTSGFVGGSDDLSFRDYDVSGALLSEKPVNLRLFAHQNNTWLASAYRNSTHQQGTGRGVELNFRNRWVPLTVTWSNSRNEEDFPDLTRITRQDQVRVVARHQRNASRSRLSWRYVDFERNLQRQEYETVSSDFTNILGRLQQQHLQLRTNARYFHQYGTFNRKQVTASSRGVWAPSGDLNAEISHQLHEQHSGGPFSDAPMARTNTTVLGARYRLYGSLTGSFRANLLRESRFASPGQGGDQVGARRRESLETRLEYQRHLVWGRIFLGYGVTRGNEDRQSETLTRSIANEAHDLTDGAEPRLHETNVDIASIVVTDLSGFSIYVRDLDYSLQVIGDAVFVYRLPGGDIVDGDTILVDYIIYVSPDIQFEADSRAFDARLDLSLGASVYLRRRTAHDTFVSGTPDHFLRDQSSRLYGCEATWHAFTVREEYETNRLRDTEYDANRMLLQWGNRLRAGLHLQASVSHTRTEHIDRDQSFCFTRADLRLTGRPTSGLVVEAESWVRQDRGRGADLLQDSDLIGHRLKLTHRIRALTIASVIYYRNAINNGTQDKRLNYSLTLTRRF